MTVLAIKKSKFHLLPILGAGVALFGFVSKEVVLDHYKKLSDALTSTRTFYELHSSLNDLSDHVTKLENKDSSHNPSLDEMTEASNRVTRASADMHEIWPLVESLPDNEATKEQYRNLHNELQTTGKPAVEAALGIRVNLANAQAYFDVYQKFQRSSVMILIDHFSLQRSGRHKTAKERLHERERTWTYISYGCYAVGGVRVVGKLYGEEAGAAE